MSTWLHQWTAEDVFEAKDPCAAFADYCQQRIGVPYPTIKDMRILRRHVKDFFKNVPDATWYTLCRVADWCKARRKRPQRVWMVVLHFRKAWSDGYLPELDPAEQAIDETVERRVKVALAVETNEWWRRRLLGSSGVGARKEAITEWEQMKAAANTAASTATSS